MFTPKGISMEEAQGFVKTTPTTNPSNSSAKGVQTPSPKSSKSDWLTEVQPALEKRGWDNVVNKKTGENNGVTYDNSGFIMRAYSGRYDNIANSSDTDPELKGALKGLKQSSINFANAVKSGDAQKANQYRQEANNNWMTVVNHTQKKNSKYHANDNFRLLNDEQNAEDYKGVVMRDEYTVAHKAEEGQNKKTEAGYWREKGYENNWQEAIKKQTKPVVTNWMNSALTEISGVSRGVKVKADDKMLAYTMSRDALLHIAKYGDENDDPNSRKEALRILTELRGKKDLTGKTAILADKKNRDSIIELSGKLGFHGSSKLFKTNKDALQRDPRYYSDDLDNIDTEFDGYKSFKEDKSNIAKEATQIFMQNKEYRNNADIFFKGDNNSVVSPYAYANAKIKRMTGKTPAQLKELGENARLILVKKSGPNPDNEYDFHSIDGMYAEALKEYKTMHKSYRQAWSDVNVKAMAKYGNTQYKLPGIGNNVNQDAGFDAVDFTLTKDKKSLVNYSGGFKQEHSAKILDYIFDEHGDFDPNVHMRMSPIKSITEKDVKRIQNGAEGKNAVYKALYYSNPTIAAINLISPDDNSDDIARAETENKKAYNTFFKDAKKKVDVTFVKNTGNNKYASYILTDRTDRTKQLQIFVPYEKLKEKDDYFNKHSNVERHENNFRTKGEALLPEFKEERESGNRIIEGQPYIRVDKSGRKVLHYTTINDSGKSVNDVYVLGSNESLNIKDAKKEAMSFLTEIIRDKNGN